MLSVIEINGEAQKWNPSRLQTLSQQFSQLFAAWQSSPHPEVQFRIDDDLLWSEARVVLATALEAGPEPRVTIAADHDTGLDGELSFVIHEPGENGGDAMLFVYLLNDPDSPDVNIGGQAHLLGRGKEGFTLLNQRILKIIGTPGSEKAISIKADIHIRGPKQFRHVRALLTALAGNRSQTKGEWVPYLKSFQLDGLK